MTVLLSLVGKVGSSAAFATIFLYSAEFFPTIIRNSALGVANFSARVGGMLAPYIVDLVRQFYQIVLCIFSNITFILFRENHQEFSIISVNEQSTKKTRILFRPSAFYIKQLKNFHILSLTKRTSMCYDIYTLRNAYISSTLTRYLQWNSTDVESLVPVSEHFVRNYTVMKRCSSCTA